MKTLLTALAAMALLVLPARAGDMAADHAADHASDARVIAALVYADWCGSCAVLDPVVQSVAAEYADQPVTFVTLDYTAKDKAAWFAQADAVSVALGTAARDYAVDMGSVKTGKLILIDASTGAKIGSLGRTNDPADVRAAVDAALAAAQPIAQPS